MNHFLKYLTAVTTPAFWPALCRGIMPGVEHFEALRLLSPKTVIDVGANKGQFSVVARYLFPDAQIYAFEPLELESKNVGSFVSGPIELFPIALGNARGSANFFVASRPDSSSLLEPGANQKAAYGVTLASEVTVSVERLDDVLEPSRMTSPVLLKLDVQGGELDVLRGAEKILEWVDAIYCEVSFVPLYDGQALAKELVEHLSNAGFGLRGAFNLSSTKEFGPTQADFLFLARDQHGSLAALVAPRY